MTVVAGDNAKLLGSEFGDKFGMCCMSAVEGLGGGETRLIVVAGVKAVVAVIAAVDGVVSVAASAPLLFGEEFEQLRGKMERARSGGVRVGGGR